MLQRKEGPGPRLGEMQEPGTDSQSLHHRVQYGQRFASFAVMEEATGETREPRHHGLAAGP